MNLYGQLVRAKFQVYLKFKKCIPHKKIAYKILNKNINVLYGGSVNTENINDILKLLMLMEY